MEQLAIGLGNRAYNIYIGQGILSRSGDLIREIFSGKRAALLSDETVWAIYGQTIMASLEQMGITAIPILLPPGEASKSLSNLESVLEQMAAARLTRSDLLIALGGGVIGDLGGFAASVYMRGIDYVQIPTTLLSQVDSSVGGKTAVNLAHGKNLAGAFWQPRLVILDTDTLDSLSPREFAGGMAEVIKYGVLADPILFDQLARIGGRPGIEPALPGIIRQCCAIKAAFVERDELDRGERMLLNLGHTFGHAIERHGEYTRFLHGEAVALGMVFAARYSEALGFARPGIAREIRNLLADFDLPMDTAIPIEAIISHISLDKKATGDTLRLILIREIGDCFIHETTAAEFAQRMYAL
ncbi:MAG: 3-dehydroquinate synthase [Oscillospiraceae bacterium]|nr:3-dehydroquinate synthase [Oscillospiraceae bacterium]